LCATRLKPFLLAARRPVGDAFEPTCDNVSAAAAALTASKTGAVGTKTIVLLTPEEMDKAAKKTVAYRAPGA
jgi:hypothetical protein